MAYRLGCRVDPTNNELFVASTGNSSVPVFGRTASGNTAPLRTLSGAATGLVFPQPLTLDLTNNEMFVGNTGSANSITAYTRGASGNTAPLRTLSGVVTGISGPIGIAVTTGVAPPPPPSAAVNVPTLSEWAQISLALLLALGGLVALRGAQQGTLGRPTE